MDTLRPWIAGSRVLDLFAGQGRFGISAVEEGASEVHFVEQHGTTSNELKKTLEHPTLSQGKTKVLSMDVWKYLENPLGAFDIVFADPPFEMWDKEFEKRLLTQIVKALETGSILLVKHPKTVVLSPWIESLHLWKTSVFGESGLTYFRYGEKG